MPLYRMQVALGADDPFPSSRIVNTLHFNDEGPLTDPQNLCDDLAVIYRDVFLAASNAREIRVTAYLVGPPPQLPVASAVLNENLTPPTSSNREIALCLSYYNERSNPRKRGRLYMAPGLTALGATTPRPSAAVMTRLLDFGDALSGLGGIDVDWVVYSPTSSAHFNVVGTWVDNAWDVVRSRGLPPTARTERTPGP